MPLWRQGLANLLKPPLHLAREIVVSRAQLEGERKYVTVMFADVSASLEIIRDLDPDETREICDACIETMTRAIHDYEGTVVRTMGDGVLALFGAPIAHEDHALRACYAALTMQRSARESRNRVSDAHGGEIRFHIGLHSGQVLVRTINNDLTLAYDAVGTTVHLASRMEGLASAGTTRMTAETAKLVEGAIEVRKLEKVEIKGLSSATNTFELISELPFKERFDAARARGLSPFTSRRREVAELSRAMAGAEASLGQLCAIVGEPGVGKSRLAHEIVASALNSAWRVLRASCSPYGTRVAYFPILMLLKQVFGLPDVVDQLSASQKVTSALRSRGSELEQFVEPLHALLNLPTDRSWDALEAPRKRDLMKSAVIALIAQLSQEQPLLLLIEDLHWIEPQSQELLNELTAILDAHRILIIVNFRPEYTPIWRINIEYRQIVLKPFDEAELEEFLDSILGRDSAMKPLKKLLANRIGGNPLFIEETIRGLLDTGQLVRRGSVIELAGPIDEIEIRGSVHAIISARIDRLKPLEKLLLQVAAGVGNPFEMQILCEVLKIPTPDVLMHLVSIQEGGFIYPTQIFPHREYAFNHALTHEVTYATLPAERRRELHAEIMRTIERLYVDNLPEFADRLAEHARRGHLWDAAVSYLRMAGYRALAQSANTQAASKFKQALNFLEKLPISADRARLGVDLRCDLRNSLELVEPEKLIGSLTEARELAEQLGDKHRLGVVASYMTHACWVAGRLREATIQGAKGVAIGKELSDAAIELSSAYHLGLAYYSLGRHLEANQMLGQVVEQTQPGDKLGLNVSPAVLGRSYLARSLAEIGDFSASLLWGKECVAFAEETGSPYACGFAYLALGYLSLIRGNYLAAVAELEHSYASFTESKTTVMAPAVAALLGKAYNHAGRNAVALEMLEVAIQRTEAMRIMVQQPLRTIYLSEAYQAAGRMDKALRVAQRALSLAQAQGEETSRAYALRQIGLLAIDRGRPEDKSTAVRSLREALTLAAELHLLPLVARCRYDFARALDRTGANLEAEVERRKAEADRLALAVKEW